jgi:4-methylaminobutanoate oxidase (formaldehyde-forming)
MKCVVIGGGVVGTSVAWHLAECCLGDVLLLERDRLGAGTTWHSAGNITWRPLSNYDAAVLYAYEVIDRLDAAGWQATGWLKTGRLFLAHSEDMRKKLAELDAAARERGVAARWLTPDEARGRHPLLEPAGLAGIWLNPLSGRVNPADLTAAYAKAARAAGARISENTAVRGLAIESGRVVGVETGDGRIDADVVVVAAGLWSQPLLASAGISIAQWPCEHFYVIASVSPSLPRDTPSFVAPDALLYGREEVGGFMVGCFDEHAKTIAPADLPDPFAFTLLPPDWDKIAPYFAAATRLFPVLENAPIRHFVNGPESFTPDGLPLIGRVPEIGGLIVATAMNSAGVTWSAMTGKLVADLVAGRATNSDAAHFDPVRFGAKAADLDWLKSRISNIVSHGYRGPKR